MASRFAAIFAPLTMRLRLARAKLRHSTTRFYTSDLRRLYARLDAEAVAYVVLRWADEVPMDAASEAAHRQDIDHLLENTALSRILHLSSRQPGPLKCDYYSVGGKRGSAYLGMPYYMPELAKSILASRVKHAKGFCIPAPKEAYLSFLYHLTYHKGARSGIETGLGVPTSPTPSRDYGSEVRRLAALAGMALPNPFTLLGLHDYLRQSGWNMANDLLLRWPDKHPVLTALIALEMRRDAPLIAAVRDLTVFMMRDDCGGAEAEALARQMIADRFTILHETRLRGDAQTRVVMQTRGGNWTEKYQTDATLPTLAFICRNAPVPGPLPVAMSADKLRRRYPHLINTDVLIKRLIRDKAAKLAGVAASATVLHATDNAFEAAETLKAIFAGDLPGRLADWVRSKD